MADESKNNQYLRAYEQIVKITIYARALLFGLLLISLFGFVFFPKQKAPVTSISDQRITEALDATRKDIEVLQGQVKAVQGTVASITKIPENAELSGRIAKVAEDVLRNTESLKALDEAILSSPEKALAIPILRKDLEAERSTLASESLSLRAELGRIYDFNKWFFGLIATMAIGLLGLAWNLRQRGDSTNPKRDPSEIP